MTDPSTSSPAVKSEAPRFGWTYYPLAFGALGFLVAFIVAAIPPAHSTTEAGEIVNFPAMFAQYTVALLIALLSSVLLLIGALGRLLRH